MINLGCTNRLLNRKVDLEVLTTQISDYAAAGRALVMQRVLIFGAALILQAAYISARHAALFAVLIVFCELFDFATFRQAKQLDSQNRKEIMRLLARIHVGAICGALVIGSFAVSITFAQQGSNYFMPLFFLLAAALFAAMNNHQIVSILVIRLVTYGAAFLFIPISDLVQQGAPLSDPVWLNLFTSIFVLYFIADCSVTALRYYRTSKRHLKQLRIENERARAALVAKTEFLSTVSHELRTPLTSIKASLDMTMAGAFGPLPEKSEDVLRIAQRNSARLSQLINELLDLQKIEVGKMKFNFEVVQVSSLVADAVADNRSFANNLGISLSMQPVDTGMYIRADRMRLEQVIANLLSNASKFSEDGNDVRMSVEATAKRVRINVHDRGVGVNEADRERIFDSFSQLDASDRRKVGGTGLGLNISKRIIEAHDGTIDFTANPDGGTTFFVTLDRVSPTATILRNGPVPPEDQPSPTAVATG